MTMILIMISTWFSYIYSDHHHIFWNDQEQYHDDNDHDHDIDLVQAFPDKVLDGKAGEALKASNLSISCQASLW